jgi:hypothetical protein
MYVVPLGLSLQVWPKASPNHEQATFEQCKTACFDLMLPIVERYAKGEIAKDELKAIKNDKLTSIMAELGISKDSRGPKAAKADAGPRKRPAAATKADARPRKRPAAATKADADAAAVSVKGEEEKEEEEKKVVAAAASVEDEDGEEEEEEEEEEEAQEPTAKLLDKHICASGVVVAIFTHGKSLLCKCSLAVLSTSAHNNACISGD